MLQKILCMFEMINFFAESFLLQIFIAKQGDKLILVAFFENFGKERPFKSILRS